MEGFFLIDPPNTPLLLLLPPHPPTPPISIDFPWGSYEYFLERKLLGVRCCYAPVNVKPEGGREAGHRRGF